MSQRLRLHRCLRLGLGLLLSQHLRSRTCRSLRLRSHGLCSSLRCRLRRLRLRPRTGRSLCSLRLRSKGLRSCLGRRLRRLRLRPRKRVCLHGLGCRPTRLGLGRRRLGSGLIRFGQSPLHLGLGFVLSGVVFCGVEARIGLSLGPEGDECHAHRRHLLCGIGRLSDGRCRVGFGRLLRVQRCLLLRFSLCLGLFDCFDRCRGRICLRRRPSSRLLLRSPRSCRRLCCLGSRLSLLLSQRLRLHRCLRLGLGLLGTQHLRLHCRFCLSIRCSRCSFLRCLGRRGIFRRLGSCVCSLCRGGLRLLPRLGRCLNGLCLCGHSLGFGSGCRLYRLRFSLGSRFRLRDLC